MDIPLEEEIPAKPDVPGKERIRRLRKKGLPLHALEMTYICNQQAPLEETPNFKVMVTLTGVGSGEERRGLDLVTVLDVSGSMGGEKLEKLKVAMRFLIKKLSPVDRLSVVAFCHETEVVCGLRQTTEKSQEEIEKQVNDLVAKGSTNIAAGLKKGLEVLQRRKLQSGRSSAIMLMSDGAEDHAGDAAKVEVGDVPVYTFGFGKDHKAQALTDVTKNGGTFSVAENIDNLSHVFAQCLGGLLTVVVEDLKLELSAIQSESTIQVVSVAKREESYMYPHTRNDAEGSVTVSFGNLYSREVRNVIVYLLLPAFPSTEFTDILYIKDEYSVPWKRNASSSKAVIITRTGRAVTAGTAVTDKEEEEEVTVEEIRLSTAEKMYQARLLADQSKFEDAKKKLLEAESILDNVMVDSPLIEMLKDEVKLMIDFTGSQDIYDKKGQSFAMSSEISHGLQRYSARGTDDIDKLPFYRTPFMDEYLKQSKKFLDDPDQPVSTAKEDEDLLATIFKLAK